METQEVFMQLVKAGDPRVEQMLSSDPSYASARDGNGVSAVLVALYHRQPDTARLIAAPREGSLDLFEAASLGELERVKQLLVQSTTKVDERSPDGYTALQLASFLGQVEVATTLAEAGADPNIQSQNSMKVSAIHAALAGGNVEIVQMLLGHGASPEEPSGEGWAPMHYASAMGSLELVQDLIGKGASTNARLADGKSPADLANENGHYDVVHFLADRG